mmetsp:Transcript_4535/g.10373  ORF Transcript_4535/g.10373 Transcript_4535/m.10373 type:complete len:213 (-) Transcript_4535:182-820(-)
MELSCLGTVMAPEEWGGITSLMLRNVPAKYTQSMLMNEIDHTSFLQTYDFLYLPKEEASRRNRGYAVINFIEPGCAWLFARAFAGRRMNRFSCEEAIEVTIAVDQGFEAIYKRFGGGAAVGRDDGPFLREQKHAPSNRACPFMAGNLARAHARPVFEKRAGRRHQRPTPEGATGAASSPPAVGFCVFCGNRLKPTFNFCPCCGRALPLRQPS